MTLTKEILTDGIKKALINSSQLIEEAKILQEHNRLARAYALYQLSIEEVGKAIMTFGHLLFDLGKEEKEKKFLIEYRSHKVKTKRSHGTDFILAMLADEELRNKVLSNIEYERQNIEKINNLKNYSLYTSFIEKQGVGIFVLPSQIISTPEKLEKIQFYAEIRLEAAQGLIERCLEHYDNIKEALKNIDIDNLTEEDFYKLFKG